MNYRVFIVASAQRMMETLPDRDYRAVRDAIIRLRDDPRPPGCVKLSGREGWRIRQGDYRIIYEIDDQAMQLTVLSVRHRREAYR